MRKMFVLVPVALAAAFGASAAVRPLAEWTTYYVATNGDDTAAGTAEAPFRNIQTAVNKADGNGTLILVGPGRYDGESGGTPGDTAARVFLSKKNTWVKSLEGRDVTFIVGKADTTAEGNDLGLGPNALRCVFGSGNDFSAQNQAVFGFTLTGGRSAADKRGGGAYNTYLYDCVVTNCAANRGGGGNSSTFVRCLITDCLCNSNYGASGYQCNYVNSLVRGVNGFAGGVISFPRYVINTTIAGNPNGTVFTEGNNDAFDKIYNTVVAGNYGVNGWSSTDNIALFCCSAKEPGGYFKTIENSVTDAAEGSLIVSSALGDARLLPSSGARNRGRTEYLSLVPLPEGYVQKDYYGTVIDTAETICHAGCCQTVLSEEESCVSLARFPGASFEIAGRGVAFRGGSHNFLSVAEPFRIRPQGETGAVPRSYYGISVKEVGSAIKNFPLYDGWVHMLSNPEQGSVMTFELQTAKAVYYVDEKNGNDDQYDGTAPVADGQGAGPKATLSGVGAVADADWNLIYVAPGVYSNGFHTSSGIRSRCAFDHAVGLISTVKGGATIVGQAADEEDPKYGHGVGTNGMRCVRLADDSGFIQGFVLTDGHTDSLTDAKYRGAAVRGDNGGTSVLDCRIVGCESARGLFNGCTILRCQIQDNWVREKLFETCTLACCEVSGNVFGHSANKDYPVFGINASAYNCSVDCNNFWANVTNTPALFGCAIDGLHRDTPPADTNEVACVRGGVLFADAAAGDLRYGCLSPAIGAVAVSALQDGDAWRYLGADIEGADLPMFGAGGTFNAGARFCATGLPCAVVNPGSGLAIENGVIGTNVLTGAATPTVTVNTERPCDGIAADGELVTTELSYQIPELAEGTSHVYSAHMTGLWYVKQDGGSDANNGWSATSAKKTIRAAAEKAVTGETILVDDGDYGAADGTMLQTAAIVKAPRTVRCRVWVKPGVTLKSVNGARSTVIRGAADSEGDEYGLGTNAVRCVVLGKGSSIDGFTLTGGHSAATDDTNYNDDYSGAAILASGYTNSIARNCVISNNTGWTSTPGYSVTFFNCIIKGNTTVNRASCGRECGYVGTVIDDNLGSQAVEQFYHFDSCTLGPSNRKLDNGRLNVMQYQKPGFAAYNSLIMKGQNQTLYTIESTNCIVCTRAEAEIDDDFRPIPDAESPLVDKVTGEYATMSGNDIGATDASGFQRVMNGARDIGALEADWRPCYGRDIGGRAKVTEVSPAVVEVEGKVSVPGGSRIAFDLNNRRSAAGEYLLSVAVGSGTLSVTMDGEPVAFEDASDIRLAVAPGEHRIAVAFAGEASDTAVIQSLRNQVGILLFVR